MNSFTAVQLRSGLQHYLGEKIAQELNKRGYATTGSILTSQECDWLAGLYSATKLFRSRIIMQQHESGRGEYSIPK